MACPSGSDYSDAVQNPSSCFNDPELKRGVVATNSMGLPIVASGQFASVFEVRAGPKRWAVRCFTRQPPNDQVEHYAALTKHLATLRLPMLAEFHHQQSGILIRGRRYPLVKMGWVEGEPLNNFVEILLKHDPKALLCLADRWRSMAGELSKHRIAHGDLQHGNVLVTKQGDFRLVDYDAMFVPALAGRACPEIGHQHFQHPKRAAKHYDQRLDHFSLLVIYASLKALASDTSLWSLSNGDSLIFQAADFKQPENSEVFQRLGANREAEVRSLSVALRNCCTGKPEAVPALEQLLASLPPAPPIPPSGVWGWSPGPRPPADAPRTGPIIQTPDWAKEQIKWDNPLSQRPTDKKKTVRVQLPPVHQQSGGTSTQTFPGGLSGGRAITVRTQLSKIPPIQTKISQLFATALAWFLGLSSKARVEVSLVAALAAACPALLFYFQVAAASHKPEQTTEQQQLSPSHAHAAALAKAKAEKAAEAEKIERAKADLLAALANATKEYPFTNSLGMRFVPVPGTGGLFSIWDTRVRDYQAFASETRQRWPTANHEQGPAHPAVNVSWEDAEAFAKWLTDKERKEGRLPNYYSYRLPRDWEWSLAVGLNEVRMATPQDQPDVKEVYPWGRQWPPPTGAGNYSKSLNVDNYEQTSPVGSFPANAFGLHDMGGNVWQWCQDLYSPNGTERVLRGAAFYSNGKNILLSSFRYKSTPEKRDDYSGFRLVLGRGMSVAPDLQTKRVVPIAPALVAVPNLVPAIVPTTTFTNSLGLVFAPVQGTEVLFCVWKTRVQDYRAFAEATGRKLEKPSFAQGPSHPAVNVSWDDAKAFCTWLTEQEQKEGKLGSHQTYRLPTDVEWSHAAGLENERGETPKERQDVPIQGLYLWGRQWPPPKGTGNYARALEVDDFDYTAPVGSFAANRFGLFDLGGNAWEWCEDWYDTDQRTRVLRGAAWDCASHSHLAATCRIAEHPSVRFDRDGFRLVLAKTFKQ